MSLTVTPAHDVVLARPPARRRSAFKKLAFSLVTLALLLAGAEVAVRVRDLVRFGSSTPGAQIYVTHPVLGKVPKPGAVLEGKETSIRINSLGFRSGEITAAKPAGTYRIACLGGSTTFGLYCRDNDHTWPMMLEQKLGERYPDRTLEVINAGVPGYTLTNSLVNLTERVLPLNPDLVIIYHAPNDLSYEQRQVFGGDRRQGEADGVWPVTQWLTEKSLLFRKVVKNVHVRWGSTNSPVRHDRLPDEAVERIRGRLEKLIGQCRARGIDVVVCTVATQFSADVPAPQQRRAAGTALYYNKHLSLVGLIDAYDRINSAIRSVGRDHALALADVARAVPGDEDHFGDSVHFTNAGTGAVANCLRDTLVRSGYISSP
ncbi:MAG: SGNH/GDSL hydrolase family protein [Phycisphaerae bacterium]